jgi:predicted transcriptional regulator
MPHPVTIDLDDLTLQALDRVAERSERTRAEIISDALQDYLELQAWQLEKIEAGLAAANAGDFASDEEIARIARKYSPPG